ncbi:hypothetical protein [Mangrovimonas xylaniphaga]|uniref:hypothetical protein n=1 Tax=Mangrovimonas xylaniphaga TaxID=1645915 RepID=UPI0006B4A8A2|nr:hypothetical protein [Mangrovimonas xylaniphaga]
MGWKCSLVIIENKENFNDDKAILNAIGKTNYVYDGETTMVDCIYPNDQSINIGYYNGNIVISEDYKITALTLDDSQKLHLSKEEKALVELFPYSEILRVACHSVTNFHGYSLIKNGTKTRMKIVDSESAKIEFGEPLKEEIEIYKNSFVEDGQTLWPDEANPGEPYTEDQLMEDFAFGIAKRRLGVQIDDDEGEELMEKIKFKKYIKSNPPLNQPENSTSTNKTEYKWLQHLIKLIIILIIWQLIKRAL